MTKTKNTKRALLMSALALLMCVSMLIGSTFAWFTDSVTSAGNIIKSGTLDVTMEWKDATESGKQTTYKDASTGAIFNYDLWEPGYVEAKNIKISNVGTLALKYALNIFANGEVSDLATVIDVYYAESELTLKDRAELTSAMTYIGTLDTVLAGMPANASGELLAGEKDTVTIALKMQETAGNEYQNKSIGADFTVQLLATQLEAELDSFDNQYDKGAAWDGTIPETQPESLVLTLNDTKNQGGTITIKDADAFVYLNKLVADFDAKAAEIEGYDNYYYHWEWNVELEADINLMNYPIDSIALDYFGDFNGNGHTISNVVMKDGQTGLFDRMSADSFGMKDLTVKNIVVNAPSANKVGAVVGDSNGTIENVNVVNATVNGNKCVGGIVGKCCSIVNSSIVDSTVTAADKTVGGLVGYSIGDPNPVTVAGNTVEDVTVTGAWNVGGLIGQAQNETVENNTVKNVMLISTTAVVDGDSTEVRTGEVVARNYNATVGTNTAENVAVTLYVSTADELSSAISGGVKKVVLNADITVDKWIMFSETLSIGNGNIITVKMDGLTIDGNGHTLTVNSIESAGNGNKLFDDASNLNVSNMTIKLAEGLKGGISLNSGVISNVNFVGGVTGVYPGNGDVKIENCTFATTGTSIYFETAKDNLTVTGCTFNNPENANVILLRGNVKFTNNTINSGRTVNIVSGSPVVTGNNFNDVRLKVYAAATATVSNNAINNLVFEADTYASTFADNTLSTEAQTKLDSVSKAN